MTDVKTEPDRHRRPTPDALWFLDPTGTNRVEARAFLHAAVDLVVDALARDPAPTPDSPVAYRPGGIPEEGLAPGALLERARQVVAGSSMPGSRGWIAHMDPPPSLASVAGDLIAAMLNNNLLSREMSPALSALEDQLTLEFAARFGLPAGAGGVMVSGGTTANLHALVLARAVGAAAGANDCGVVTSDQAHVSVDKAVSTMGIAPDAFVRVPTGSDGHMRGSDVRQAIKRLRGRGTTQVTIVATAGTTVLGAVDPLAELAEVARAESAWLHVDAAFGGALQFSARWASRLAGIDLADSIAFNPHKLLYVARACAMLLFRDASGNVAHFAKAAPYMDRTPGRTNLGELSLQGSRDGAVLKLWLGASQLGWRGVDSLVDRACSLAVDAAERVRRRPGLELASEPDTALVILRAKARPGADQDVLNIELRDHLRRAGYAVSVPVHRSARWVRLVFLNPAVGEPEIDALFDAVDAFLEAHPLDARVVRS